MQSRMSEIDKKEAFISVDRLRAKIWFFFPITILLILIISFFAAKMITKPIKSLTKYLNRLYSNNEYQSYIINYLLINYNVRNLDLDLIVTDDMKEYHNLGKKGDENVLFVGKNNAVYFYRNNYKTVKTYGPKAIRLSSVKLAKSIKGYMAQQQAITNGDIYLLSLLHYKIYYGWFDRERYYEDYSYRKSQNN